MDKEAFLYYWLDSETNKMYLGVHKGTPEDGYVTSSKLLKQLINIAPNRFKRVIVAYGKFENLLQIEANMLNKVNAKNNEIYYNQHNGNGKFVNKFHTNETKQKISILLTGKPKSTKHRISMSLCRLGKKLKPASEERKRKISLANTGKRRTDAQKLKMSIAAKGRPGSKAAIGKKHFNNGVISTMAFDCPAGYIPGRLWRKGKK